jgi:hypothetical protein
MDADRAAVKLPRERQLLGVRLKSLVKGILGWLATLVGVLVLILMLGEGSGRVGLMARPVIAVAADILVLVGVVVAIAYVLVRRHNKARQDVSEPSAVLATTRLTQSWLGGALGRIDEWHDFRFDRGNIVLSDATRITAATMAEYDGWRKIAFLWFARPAQADGFLASTQFTGLPTSAQDAVVLLDLRRELALRGLDAFRATSSGFYCHDMDRIAQAALRTGNTDLFDLLKLVQTVPPGQSVNSMTTTVLDELDKQETWEGLFAPKE